MDTVRRSLMFSPLALVAGGAAAQTAAPTAPGSKHVKWPAPIGTIDLWPNGVTGQLHGDMQEVVEDISKDSKTFLRRVHGISKPRLAVFPAKKPNGSAMLVIPGGGFTANYFDHEGYQLADFLNGYGITCFVLFYRLANDGWDKPADVALIDTQRAMRVIKANAAKFHIDAARTGVIGFSAGGFLTASLATRHAAALYPATDAADRLDARPMLAAPIYPVQSVDPAYAYSGVAPSLFGGKATPEIIAAYSPDMNVNATTSPCFLVHAEDDVTVPVANSTRLRDACKAAKVPVEMHLFASGGHGFGMKGEMNEPDHVWPDLFVNFARRQGLMTGIVG